MTARQSINGILGTMTRETPKLGATDETPRPVNSLGELCAITHSNALGSMTFQGSRYAIDDRIRAVVSYLTTGSQAATSRMLGIPASTLCEWRQTEWWEAVSDEVRSQHEDRFRAGFAAILDRAQLAVLDRLEHGDSKLVRVRETRSEGGTKDFEFEARRVPVSMRDASLTAAIFYDKLRLSLNLPTSITAGNNDGKLKALAEQFAELSGQVNARTLSAQNRTEPDQHKS